MQTYLSYLLWATWFLFCFSDHCICFKGYEIKCMTMGYFIYGLCKLVDIFDAKMLVIDDIDATIII